MAKGDDIKADPTERLGLFRRRGGGENGKKKSSGRWLLHFFILLMLFLASGVAIVWYMMDGDFAAPDAGDVPLILADKTPVKVRPDDPGGMEVPGRDRLVYDRLEGGDAEGAGTSPQPESLLPPPEEPLPPPSGDEQVVAEFKAGDAAPEAAPKAAPEAAPVAEPVEEQPPAPPPAAPKTVEAAPVVAPKATPSPTPAPTPEAGDGAYLIQIAALRSRDAAEQEWARLQKAHTDLLGELTLMIQRADLGADKGVFYRLRAGRLSEARARALCVALGERKVGCLPVKAEN